MANLQSEESKGIGPNSFNEITIIRNFQHWVTVLITIGVLNRLYNDKNPIKVVFVT